MNFQRLLYQSLVWRGLFFASSFLLNILLSRYYQAAVSGWIYFISNFYSFIFLIASVSLESGMGFYASRNEMPIHRLANFSLVWTLIVSLLLIFIMYFFVSGSFSGVSTQVLLLSSLSYVSGNLLTTYCSALFYGKKNFITPNVICIGCNVLLTVLLVIAILFPHSILNAKNFVLIYFMAFLLQGTLIAIAIKVTYAGGRMPALLLLPEIQKVLRYSLTALVSNIIYFLVYRVDYWFVKNYCTSVELGNYIQVSKIGQMLVTVPSILASAVFPMVAGGQQAEVNRGLKMLSRLLLLGIGALCGLLAITGSWLFPFVFGPSFRLMYYPFLLLIPGLLSISALYPLAAYYSGINMISVNIKASLLALAAIVTTDYLFIPHFGITAAALISSIGYTLCYGYVLAVYTKTHGTSVTGFFIFRSSDFLLIKNLILMYRNIR